jgi:hypothetical protein
MLNYILLTFPHVRNILYERLSTYASVTACT